MFSSDDKDIKYHSIVALKGFKINCYHLEVYTKQHECDSMKLRLGNSYASHGLKKT